MKPAERIAFVVAVAIVIIECNLELIGYYVLRVVIYSLPTLSVVAFYAMFMKRLLRTWQMPTVHDLFQILTLRYTSNAQIG